MSRTTKIVLGVVAGLLALCAAGGCAVVLLLRSAANKALITDRARLEAAGRAIADYDLPAAYREQFGVKLLGVTMVAMARDQDSPVIMLMQMPRGGDVDQVSMERQMEQALRQSGRGGSGQMRVVGSQQVTIRGREVTLTVSESAASEGAAVRQMSGVFEGKGGQALLMIMGPKSTWDQESVDAFIASMR